MSFVENKGQWHENVEFRVQESGATVYLEGNKIKYQVFDPQLLEALHKHHAPTTQMFQQHVYEVEFLNSRKVLPQGEKKLEYYHNYYLSADTSNWADHVGLYEKIRYSNLYNGIDLILYPSSNSFKYDFIIAPGADPSQIILDYAGVKDISIVEDELVIETVCQTIKESAPYTYQFIDNKIIPVPCSYQLKNNKLTFKLGTYDPNFELIIDPELIFSSNTPGTASNFGFTATYDSQENLIGGGNVFEPGYPTTVGAAQLDFNGGSTDAFLTKWNEEGTNALFSTYLGGSNNERPHSLVADSDDNVFMFGTTGSSNFAVSGGAYDTSFNGGPSLTAEAIGTALGEHPNGCDIFIAKFNASTGALNSCTFVGGSGNDGLNLADDLNYNYGDFCRGEIIINTLDQVIVATTTSSSNFPVSNFALQNTYGGGSSDGVVFMLDNELSTLEWATYYGGSGSDALYTVQNDEVQNVVVAGGTSSNNIPMSPNALNSNNSGGIDGFVAKLDPFGSDLYAGTYLGTSSYDQVYLMQVDTEDGIYVTGQSTGNYPVQGNVYSVPNSGQFFHKLNSDLTSTEWSTVIGSGNGEVDVTPTAFSVDYCNKILYSAWGGNSNEFSSATSSSTFGLPVTADAWQTTTDGSDFYLMVLEEDAEDLLFGTFFGGNSSDEHVDGGTSRFSKKGVIYHAVCSGCGSVNDYPTSPGAWGTNTTFNCEIGVFKARISGPKVEILWDGEPQACVGESVQFLNNSEADLEFEWNLGNGVITDEVEPSTSYANTGVYNISLDGSIGGLGCTFGNQDQLQIEILDFNPPSISGPDFQCEDGSIYLSATGTENAIWENGEFENPAELTQETSIEENTTFVLSDFNLCGSAIVEHEVVYDEVDLFVNHPPEICINDVAQVSAIGANTYDWYFSETGQFLGSGSSIEFSPGDTTSYYVEGTSSFGCLDESDFTIGVVFEAPGSNEYGPYFVCIGDTLEITASVGDSYIWSPNGEITQSILVNPEENSEYSVLITNVCGSGTDIATVEVGSATANAMAPDSICFGEEIELLAEGGLVYDWINTSNNQELESNIVSPEVTTTYQVVVTAQNTCTDTDETTITVLPLPLVEAGANQEIFFLEETTLYGYVQDSIYWWSYDPDLSCLDCLYPTVNPNENSWYFLNAIDEHGCYNYDGVLVELEGPLHVPNSFTPDGDGFNDIFKPEGLILNQFNMQIYNRWGEVVFETNSINEGWDGTYKGHEPKPDTYTWRIEYDDYKYGRSVAVGHVTLID